MLDEINGRIEVICDGVERFFILTMKQENAALFLAYIEGLEFQRIPAFRVSSNQNYILLSGATEIAFRLEYGEDLICSFFTSDQIELIKCCCLDAIFHSYPKPHIDLVVADISVCIGFE